MISEEKIKAVIAEFEKEIIVRPNREEAIANEVFEEVIKRLETLIG